MRRLHLVVLIIAALVFVPALRAYALEPPPPGMIDQMKAEGIYEDALKNAERFGNHIMKAPKRGAQLDTTDPHRIAGMIGENWGRSLDEKSASAIAASSQRELSWVSLDLNHDRIVDERDVLALGSPRPKLAAGYPSIGTAKCFVLLIDFPDYPAYFSNSNIENRMFGEGDSSFWYRSLYTYYKNASYNQLTVTGDVFGWYTAKKNRTWYHPNDNNAYPDDNIKRELLFYEAIDDADAKGADFSQYDNDGDGYVDYFLVIYTGPQGAWASFWWGYQWTMQFIPDKIVDGVRFGTYSFQWERRYNFGATPPTPANWDALVAIHETGHALGLPDYYDYNSNPPRGGVGGMDMMDANQGDHNSFSKYVLGWLSPTIAFKNLNDQQMRKSNAFQDAVLFMPGFDPTNPWAEYFMAQVRYREGADNFAHSNGYYPTDGRMAIWHVDARVNASGKFDWDNSNTSHKLLRLMEADGLEEIETGDLQADIGDYYNNGESLTNTTVPNSKRYDGTSTGIIVNDISVPGQTMTADFTLYTSNPPTVAITAPGDGDTVSGDVNVTVSASDDVSVSRVQLFADDVMVREWASGPYSYTWNTRADFNGTRKLLARAWDDGGQSSSDSFNVTVSNSGTLTFTDGFGSGLGKWRVINHPEDSAGGSTVWATRTSPGTPPPLGSGSEAWIDGVSSTTEYYCSESLRTERINAVGYARPVHIQFYYRCRDPLTLFATTDNGASWERVANLASSTNWAEYTNVLYYAGSPVYFRLYYDGRLREDQNSGLGANIDDFLVRECPSAPPTATITSPADGEAVTGTMAVNVSASDDVAVTKVLFYVNGALVSTDTTSPWQYTRNTLNDDNHPSIKLKAVAVDGDNLVSIPAEITVAFKNPRPYPVADNLESGTANWSVSNDSRQPQWTLVNNQSRSPSNSYGWVGGGWQTNSNDLLTYTGYTPASGYQTIDLTGELVKSPVLRFWYKSDITSTSTWRVYFHNTWLGWQMVSIGSGDMANWTEETVDLWNFAGYSGRVAIFALTGGTATGGTGLWIDDIRVENKDLEIFNISPTRALAGETLTIDGTNFWLSRGTSYVTFGGNVNPASGDYVSWGNTQIKVKIPLTAKSGDVKVTVGSNTSNGKDLRVVLGPPIIDGGEQY